MYVMTLEWLLFTQIPLLFHDKKKIPDMKFEPDTTHIQHITHLSKY